MKHPILGTGELTPAGTTKAAKSIRKAISHAIPRETIINETLGGLGSPGVTTMPEVCIGFNESLQPCSFDLDLAKEFMEAAGYSYLPEKPNSIIYKSIVYTLAGVAFIALSYGFFVIRKKRNLKMISK